MGRGHISSCQVYEILRRKRNKAYFSAEGYVSMDRPEICEVSLDITIDNVLGAENSSYTNTFKVN